MPAQDARSPGRRGHAQGHRQARVVSRRGTPEGMVARRRAIYVAGGSLDVPVSELCTPF